MKFKRGQAVKAVGREFSYAFFKSILGPDGDYGLVVPLGELATQMKLLAAKPDALLSQNFELLRMDFFGSGAGINHLHSGHRYITEMWPFWDEESKARKLALICDYQEQQEDCRLDIVVLPLDFNDNRLPVISNGDKHG